MTQVGFDINDEEVRVARVSNDLGRPVVERLEQVALKEIPGQPWLNSCRPVFSIADSFTRVKALNLNLTSQMSYRDAGQFEMARTLLDREEEFLFATYPTEIESSYVGTICRRDKLSKIVDRVGFAPKEGYRADSFIPRAAALGAGYLTYCQPEPGELTGLIDLTEQSASICLIYRRRIVSIGHFPLEARLSNESKDHRSTVTQAKTMINLLTSRLSTSGLNVPMATLILTGGESAPGLSEQFGNRFACGVSVPRPNPAYFNESLTERPDISRYLVAMGLAFNSLAR